MTAELLSYSQARRKQVKLLKTRWLIDGVCCDSANGKFESIDPAVLFGGFKASGIGRKLGEQAPDAYIETNTVTLLRS